MKLYLTKNAGRNEFANVYEALRTSYPEKVRREIYPVQFNYENPGQKPPIRIIGSDLAGTPILCMAIHEDGELTGFMKRYKYPVKLPFMARIALDAGATHFLGIRELPIHQKLADLLDFKVMDDPQLAAMNAVANLFTESRKSPDVVRFGAKTEKRNGPRELLNNFILEIADNYIVRRLENSRESLKSYPLEVIARMTSRNIVPLIPEDVDWETFVRISPREDPETIMAAVLLDREGEFHIFHDYSVPQHVDFSALA